jgi:glycosyltransferase involved in cell wall biosynthesis
MKVGLFSDTFTPDVNGVVTVVRLMQKELSSRGHDVHLFVPEHPERSDGGEKMHSFPSVPFIFYPGMRAALPYARGTLNRIPNLDLAHSHTMGPIGLVALAYSMKHRIPHVHTYHTYYVAYRKYLPLPLRPTRRMVIRSTAAFCNRCDAVVAPSDQMKRELEGYRIARPIYAGPFGLDEEEFSREIEWDVRAGLALPAGDLLLYVGRLGTEKNLGFLLRAFKRLLAYRESARLIIAGGGPERSNLEAFARELGIAPFVIFTGYLDRKRLIDLYRQTLFVFASKTETQGIVLMEAMMAGSPVIAVKAMGVLDSVRHGETGILVEEDEDEFARACHRLLKDDVQRNQMGGAAQAWARSRSARASTDRLLEIYLAVGAVGSAKASAPG